MQTRHLLSLAAALTGCGLAPASPADNPAAPPAQGPTVDPGSPTSPYLQDLVHFTANNKGVAGDPVNLVITGTEGQLRELFKRAGCLEADPVSTWTSLKLVEATVRHKPYPSAPISALYLLGRSQDLAFQIPTADVAVRDHFRLWQAPATDAQGRPAWVGACSKDIGIKLTPGRNSATHQIDPQLDEERQVLVDHFVQTGLVVSVSLVAGIGQAYQGTNASGDRYFTDGKAAVLETSNFPAREPAIPSRGRPSSPTDGAADPQALQKDR